MIRLVICAAVKNRETGVMICGPRHGECFNSVIDLGIDKQPHGDIWECGFVDQDNVFMSRKGAWKVADAAGQIRRPTTFERDYKSHRRANVGDEGLLFSENLY